MTYQYIQIGTTNECYVAGLVGGSADMSIVPLNGVIGGVSYKVVGFADDCFEGIIFTNANFGDLQNGPLSQIYGNIKYIGAAAFQESKLTGAFPALPSLQTINTNAFINSIFNGAFPALPLLQTIGNNAFSSAQFTGAFPALNALVTIGNGAFSGFFGTGSPFSAADGSNTFMLNVSPSALVFIGNRAFYYAQFAGAFPALPLLQTIGVRAFSNAQFTGAFPALNKLQTIGLNAFSTYGLPGVQGGSPFTVPPGGATGSNTFMLNVSPSVPLVSIGASAFYYAQFAGAFPDIPSLTTIGSGAFASAQFDAPTITTLNPTGVAGLYTLYCTGLVDTNAGGVGVSFGGVPVSNPAPTYTNDKIVFTIPTQVTPTDIIQVSAGNKSSSVTFTYQTSFSYSFKSVPSTGTTLQCYVTGPGAIPPSPASNMPTVPGTVIVGTTPYTVVGFADNCLQSNTFTNANFGDLTTGPLSLIKNDLRYIGNNAFYNAVFTGAFPTLNALVTIGINAFYNALFTGAFPTLNALQTIGDSAFYSAQFTGGAFMAGAVATSCALALIDASAFYNALFVGAFPTLNALQTIGTNAFYSAQFTGGAFMAGAVATSCALTLIDISAFYNAQFTGAFPTLNALVTIGNGAFAGAPFTGGTFMAGAVATSCALTLIDFNAFASAQFTGAFPALNALQTIGNGAFFRAPFTGGTFMAGAVATSCALALIDISAFYNAQFTGAFPTLNALVTIGNDAFSNAQFTGAFPALNKLQTIGLNAFSTYGLPGVQGGSPFTVPPGGATGSNTFMLNVSPSVPLVSIGASAFYYAQFAGAFPTLTNLAKTDISVFYNSTFSAPTITTTSPTGAPSASYTLSCTGLVDTNAGTVSAKFGTIDPLTLTSYTNNKIVFTIPTQTPPVYITVKAGNQTSSPPVLFTYPTPPSPPGPPLDPVATSGDTTIALSWSAPSSGGAVDSYSYSINSGGTVIPVPSSTDATRSYIITGLTNNTLYPCTIYAKNSIGLSAPSTTVQATPNPTSVPNAPNLSVSSCTVGDTTITLFWTAPSTIPPSVYSYAYSATKSGDQVIIVPISNVLTYNVTGLTNGAAYLCKVYAQNTQGYSAPSSATFTGTPVTNPDPPTGVVATAGAGSAAVSWTAPNNNGGSPINSYTVTSNPLVTPRNTTGTTLTYPALTNGTQYTFTVKATNAANLTSIASAPSQPVTPSTIPNAPTSPLASAGILSAVVSWVAPSNGGAAIDYYTITNNRNSATYSPTSSPFTVINLLSTLQYTFSITAHNKNGLSSPALTNSVTPTAATNPSAPQNVSAIAGNASANVSWTTPVSTGATSITNYTVTSNPPVGGSQIVDGTLLSYNYGGLTNGIAYTFSVTATNNGGLVSPSGTSESVTPADVEAPPEYIIQVSSFNVFGTNFRGMGNLGDYY